MNTLTIRDYLNRLGYNVANDETYQHINEWERWYKGYVSEFHKYNVYNGLQYVSQERYRLNMAKTICEDWASLILNERVKISTGTDFDKIIESTFDYNNFQIKANQLIELAFAFGTGAFVEYLDDKKQVVIDYIRAGMIYPLSWENGYINECAFGSTRETSNGAQIYLQIHRLENGKYIIENHLIDAESGNQLADDKLLPVVETRSTEPLFQFISPNCINNINLESPMGISVYANAVSQLKGCDLVYDSYMNEFSLGRRRILVPLSMAKMKMSESGATRPIFDVNDTTFYAIPDNRDNQQKIESMDMNIRANEHELGITKALDLLSFKCGMGTGRYRFVNGAVTKTATEVISAKSELYQSLRKHELNIGSALKALVRSIAYLYGKETPKDIVIDFDDSIIEDKTSERNCDRNDVSMGAMSLVEYRMKWYNETEQEASEHITEQSNVIVN